MATMNRKIEVQTSMLALAAVLALQSKSVQAAGFDFAASGLNSIESALADPLVVLTPLSDPPAITNAPKPTDLASPRPLIAVGVVEGVVSLSRDRNTNTGPSARLSDGFENDLRRWQRHFDHGRIGLAGHTTFFAKGEVGDQYLLTTRYDSEKDLRQRGFANINPDDYYPVMGDAAVRGLEADSSERFYIRVDKGQSYALYGDFSTGAAFSQIQGGGLVSSIAQRDLGQYNRTMTGVRLHQEGDSGYLDAFAMHDSLRHAVEEYRGNGTSGPFSVGNANALENSEKIEVIVRDRNNTSKIISSQPLFAFLDYTFEPFSGRILLKAPLASFDAQLNPISLRISYEVDTGGEKYWVYGVSGQRRLAHGFELGANLVRDENPLAPLGTGFAATAGGGQRDMRQLLSANLGMKTGAFGKLVVEIATTQSATATGDIDGNAARLDWGGQGQRLSAKGDTLNWQARVYAGSSGRDFNNPAASFTAGRSEAALKASLDLTATTRLAADASYTADDWLDIDRSGAVVSVAHDLTQRLTVDAGVRYLRQSQGAALSVSSYNSSIQMPGQGPVFGGAGLNPNGAGFWGTGTGLDPITGQPQNLFNGQPLSNGTLSPALDATSVRAGLKYMVMPDWSIGGELGHDQGVDRDPFWVALSTSRQFAKGRVFARIEAPTGRASAGGDYNILKTVSVYGRWEQTNGLASTYALDSANRSQAIVFGVRNTRTQGNQEYSEMRLREGMNGRDLENATGLRQTFPVSDHLSVNIMGERLKIMKGDARSALALGGGLEWLDNLWQASTRLEWRQLERSSGSLVDNTSDSWMSTVSVVRKIDQSWTVLGRNYLLLTDDRSSPGFQLQNRFQLGAAVRPEGRNDLDVLLRYENKYEQNSERDPHELRKVNLISTSANWHPAPDWWTSGRIAVKDLTETLSGVKSPYQAWLVSGRVIYDLTDRIDTGILASVMGDSQDRALQYALGAEVGYLVHKNVWISLGYNVTGFNDPDLSSSDYTRQGVFLRLRMKFDESLFKNSYKVEN